MSTASDIPGFSEGEGQDRANGVFTVKAPPPPDKSQDWFPTFRATLRRKSWTHSAH